MSLNLSLPATGVTKHKDFYSVMRENFSGLNNKYTTPVKYNLILMPSVVEVATDPVYYYVDGAGYVHLCGSVSVSSCLSTGAHFFTLPSGHRPNIKILLGNQYGYNPPATLGGNGWGVLVLYPYDDATYPGKVSTLTPHVQGTAMACSFNGIVFKGM
jgi:hypothetical protein